MTKFEKIKTNTTVGWAYLPNKKLFLARRSRAKENAWVPTEACHRQGLRGLKHAAFTLAESARRPLFNSGARRAAFTLAEVLITLAVIGIVAALTIPNLVQNYKKSVVETKLKTFYVTMNQAITLSELENGPVETWGMSTGSRDKEFLYSLFNKYFKNYLKVIKIDEGESPSSNGTNFPILLLGLPNGSVFSIQGNNQYDITLFIDEKAVKNPEAGKNNFLFRIITPAENNEHYGKMKFAPYAQTWDGTYNGLFHNERKYGCGEKHSNFCAKLIEVNNWKIPKDYPFKF